VLGVCERCGKPATERHHKDGDTGNNVRSNLAFLCRRCHMIEDGRLARFEALARANARRQAQPPKPCANCGRPAKPLRRGLCGACAEYRRSTGRDRPASLWGPPCQERVPNVRIVRAA
jgi:predicted amidophosphoribosyltransferase